MNGYESMRSRLAAQEISEPGTRPCYSRAQIVVQAEADDHFSCYTKPLLQQGLHSVIAIEGRFLDDIASRHSCAMD